MRYKLYLKCTRCNRQSCVKEYDVTHEKIRQMIKAMNMALKMPRYLVCPQCHGLFSVKVMLITIK